MGCALSSPLNLTSRSRTPLPPTWHPVLYNDDILAHIFNMFNPYDRTDRSTCALSARVCRAWTEPASKAIWGTSYKQLMDLYTVLLPAQYLVWAGYLVWADNEYMSLEYLEQMKHKRPYEDPIVWASFLRCGARIQKLELTYPKPGKAEMVELLVTRNAGTTFLPSLRSVHWTEGPAMKGALLALASPSFECVKLDIWKGTPSSQVDHLLAHLSKPAPFIRSLTVHMFWNSRPISITSFLAHLHVVHLSLEGNIALSPAEFNTLVALPRLETLRVNLSDFDTCRNVLNVPTLRELHCTGTCSELTSLVSHLRALELHGLDVQVDEAGSAYSISEHHALSRAVSESVFAGQLVSFRLGNTNSKDPPTWGLSVNAVTQIVRPMSLRELLEPLYGRTPLLSTLIVDFGQPMSIADDDVLRLAKAWPTLRSLTIDLAYMDAPRPPPPRLSPVALCHFADAFPELMLLKLRMEYVHAGPLTNITWSQRKGAGHPLRVLGLDMFLPCGREERVEFARLVARLFPNLDVEECLAVNRGGRAHEPWAHGPEGMRGAGGAWAGTGTDLTNMLRQDWLDAQWDVFDAVRVQQMFENSLSSQIAATPC